MKRVLLVFGLLLMLCACTDENTKENGIKSFTPDLSEYTELLSENKGVFKGIDIDGIKDIIDNKKSAIILLSEARCRACQSYINDVAEVAKENNLTIYYFDYATTFEDSDARENIVVMLEKALREDPEKGTIIGLPELIRFVDGEIADYKIGNGKSKLQDFLKAKTDE